MAMTDVRNVPQLGNDAVFRQCKLAMKANVKIFAGAFVMVDASGWALEGATATGQIVVGRARTTVDNTGGANGAKYIEVERGSFACLNSGSDPVAQAQIMRTVYLVDGTTIAAGSGGATRSVAGTLMQFENGIPYVEFGNFGVP